MTPANVFFLAAGLGTRLRPLTLLYPKPAIPFLNVPLGLYQFRFLHGLSLENMVANTYHLPEKIHGLYANRTFQFSDEKGAILGSAGGLKKASALFNPQHPILLLNADEIYFTEQPDFLEKALQQHLKNKNLATLVTMKHPEAGSKFGAIWCEENRVTNIGKQRTNAAQYPWHYIGALWLDPKVLSMIPDNTETNIFYDILIQHLQNEKVEIFGIDCRWYETGNWNDYFAATKSLLGSLDQKTLDFINLYDPSRLIENPTGFSLVSDSKKVDASRLKGFNVIGQSVSQQKLDSLPLIENSVLFENEVLNLGYFS